MEIKKKCHEKREDYILAIFDRFSTFSDNPGTIYLMTSSEFRTLALSFPHTEANAHFDRTAFKITGKRIFATLHEESATANLKLSPVDQSVFCDFGRKAVYPVPNKWGLQGWTTFDLKKVPKELMLDALDTAYQEVLKKKK